MKDKTRRIILIVIYAVLLFSTLVTVMMGVTEGADSGQVGDRMISWGYFKAFTPDSNILCAVFAAVSLCCLLGRKGTVPHSVKVLNLIGTVAVSLTFIVVVVFLAPAFGWLEMYEGGLFHFHLLNPLLAVAALLISAEGAGYSGKERLLPLIPVAVYGAVYFYCVMGAGIWRDFYGFSFGGRLWASCISAVVILAVSYGVSCLLAVICRGKK